MLKLICLVPETINRMNKLNENDILAFKAKGIINHWYVNDPERWFSYYVIRFCYNVNEICDWYKMYNCNDDHIISLGIYCCKKKGWL